MEKKRKGKREISSSGGGPNKRNDRGRGARDREEGKGGMAESGQCVILRRLRKTRRPPARFASGRDLKIEGRAGGTHADRAVGHLVLHSAVPLSPERRGSRVGERERGHFASHGSLDRAQVRIEDA